MKIIICAYCAWVLGGDTMSFINITQIWEQLLFVFYIQS